MTGAPAVAPREVVLRRRVRWLVAATITYNVVEAVAARPPIRIFFMGPTVDEKPGVLHRAAGGCVLHFRGDAPAGMSTSRGSAVRSRRP